MMPRILRATLIAILAISQMVGMANARPKDDHSKDRPRPAQQLGLSGEQASRLRQILQRSRNDSERMARSLTDERRRLFSMYDDYRLNEGRARDSIRRINRLQLDLLNKSLDRQLGIRSVLNQDQFEQLGQRLGSERVGRIDGAPAVERAHRKRELPHLDLAPDQQAAVEKLWQQGRKNSEGIFREMRGDLQSIDELYSHYRLDERAVRRLISDINKSQLRLMQSKLDWQLQIRKILSEQQFNALTASRPKRPPFQKRFGRP